MKGDTVRLSAVVLEQVEQDRLAREQRRLELSRKFHDPSLGPGMW